jgi:hypothetical protein
MLNECFDENDEFFKPDYEKLVTDISRQLGLKTLDWGYCGGRPFLKLDWCERPQMEAIFNALIQHKMNFQLAMKRLPGFGPRNHKDTYFSMNMIEPRIMESLQETMVWATDDWLRSTYRNEAVVDVWNWKTPAGQILCKKLRSRLHLPSQDHAHTDNFYNWESYTNFDEWSKHQTIEWF